MRHREKEHTTTNGENKCQNTQNRPPLPYIINHTVSHHNPTLRQVNIIYTLSPTDTQRENYQVDNTSYHHVPASFLGTMVMKGQKRLAR